MGTKLRTPAPRADERELARLQAILADAGQRVKLAAAFGPLRDSETRDGLPAWGEQTTLAQTFGGRWGLLTESESVDVGPSWRPVEPMEAALWLLDAATALPADLQWVAALANPPAALAATLEYVQDRRPDLLGETPAKIKRPRRAPRGERQPKPLTPRQSECYAMVMECGGDMAKAARRLSLDRKTVEQHHNAALAKLGRAAVKKHKTRQLPQDQRGQAHVAQGDDARP